MTTFKDQMGQVVDLEIGYYPGVSNNYIPQINPNFVVTYSTKETQLISQEGDKVKFRVNTVNFNIRTNYFTHIRYVNNMPYKISNFKFVAGNVLEIEAVFDPKMYIVSNPSKTVTGFLESTINPEYSVNSITSDQLLIEKKIFDSNIELGGIPTWCLFVKMGYSLNDINSSNSILKNNGGSTTYDDPDSGEVAQGEVGNFTDTMVLRIGLSSEYTPARILTGIALSNYFDKCLDIWMQPSSLTYNDLGTITIDAPSNVNGIGSMIFSIVDTKPKKLLQKSNTYGYNTTINYPDYLTTINNFYNRDIVIRSNGLTNKYNLGDLLGPISSNIKPSLNLRAMLIPGTDSSGTSILFSYTTSTMNGFDAGYILESVDLPCIKLTAFADKITEFWKRNEARNALAVVTAALEIGQNLYTGGVLKEKGAILSSMKVVGQALGVEATLLDYKSWPLQTTTNGSYAYKPTVTVSVTDNPLRYESTDYPVMFNQNIQRLLNSPSKTAISYSDTDNKKISDFMIPSKYGNYGYIQGNFYVNNLGNYPELMDKISDTLKEGIRIGY